MGNFDKKELSTNLMRIVKGSITAIIITLLLLFIFAILLTYTNLQENIINPVLIVITAISILIGSSISTLKIKKNGLLNGGFVGIIYILTIYLLSSLTGSGFTCNINTIIMMVASIVAGMFRRNYRSKFELNKRDAPFRSKMERLGHPFLLLKLLRYNKRRNRE